MWIMDHDAFVSYVREDSEIVDQLCRELRASNIRLWVDRNELAVGVRWETAIRDAIRKGAFFICCFSANSVSRGRSYMN